MVEKVNVATEDGWEDRQYRCAPLPQHKGLLQAGPGLSIIYNIYLYIYTGGVDSAPGLEGRSHTHGATRQADPRTE